MQALARHDLIDLILSSRIPIPRLVDWVDQAVLYQHAPQETDLLRSLGIRTATDMLVVCGDPVNLAILREALVSDHPGSTLRPELLATVLAHDEWLSYVRHWRENDGTRDQRTLTYTSEGSATVTCELLAPVVPRQTRSEEDQDRMVRAAQAHA